MNLKLKRLVRTVSSEQYALFDLDRTVPVPATTNQNAASFNSAEQMPMTIGKLDLHYTSEGAYGTFLLWDEALRQLRPSARRDFVRALLDEVTQPMGVPNEYVVEFFVPTLDQYELIHNVGVEGEAAEQSATEISHTASDRSRRTVVAPAQNVIR